MRKVVRPGDLVVDPVKHEVAIAGAPVQLTMTEFKLLQFLIVNRGRAYTRNEFLNAVLGKDSTVVDRNVDVHVAPLRKKLGESGKHILTNRGLGYKFSDDQTTTS